MKTKPATMDTRLMDLYREDKQETFAEFAATVLKDDGAKAIFEVFAGLTVSHAVAVAQHITRMTDAAVIAVSTGRVAERVED